MSFKSKIIVFPHPPGAGGPGSFQSRFETILRENNWEVSYKVKFKSADVVFVVGGTRKLFWLWKMKKKGIPIIYRLDGIPWLHKKKKVGFKTYFKVEMMIMINKFIHGFLADKIVYQSQFVKDWWFNSTKYHRNNTFIIYNGVSIPDKKIIEETLKSRQQKRLVILEAVIDYSPYAIKLLNELAETLPVDIDIEIYGKFENKKEQHKLNKRLQYKGFIARQEVERVMRGSVYLSLDINPACPNTVIEALASGAPVVGFDTGALKELVDFSCGNIVAYGSSPWDLEYPDIEALRIAITDVFIDYDQYAKNAYKKAKDNFDLQKMTEKYNFIIEDMLQHEA